ncbi:GGDEF domain-containing protein [Mycolicibacterium pyrenivorans]|uniref:GGDEF domain-containing protein n=1 Tax=Mycolicibacterium pyrenivorans TaxID=187102 RepID=UPI0021F3008C|nr:sensor domain-containing diguanylate cyclase [Mycolicibacterium pyrenivorans]MCV7153249.1 sensor domain-containing diguanylate cyclase [Mycolicibacterium pyrenivorans]
MDISAIRAALRISQAVSGARHLNQALEVVAEQSLLILDAASFSISRWERQRGVLRTLINVGALGPGEERWPEDEFYPLTEYRLVTDLLRHGEPYVNSIDDHDADDDAVALIRSLEKESELAVPVMVAGAMWGELWAAGHEGRRFGGRDIQILQAIATQLSIAIETAKIFSEMSRCANEDALTGLANRRALDERLSDCKDGGERATLLMGDLDGLKVVNDQHGHPAGDALLRAVADVLSAAASTVPDALVARLGGDEFCIMMPNSTLSDAQRLACDVTRLLTAEVSPAVSLCWGAATVSDQIACDGELIAAADAALLEAKKLGPGRLAVHCAPARQQPAHDSRRRPDTPLQRQMDRLVARVVAVHEPALPLLSTLEMLAVELTRIAGAAAWCVSIVTDDRRGVKAVAGLESSLTSSGLRLLAPAEQSVYSFDDYPATAAAVRNGAVFIAATDRDDSDPAEVALLREYGYRAALVAGMNTPAPGYVMEIFADGPYPGLAEIVPHATVLMHYCCSKQR